MTANMSIDAQLQQWVFTPSHGLDVSLAKYKLT